VFSARDVTQLSKGGGVIDESSNGEHGRNKQKHLLYCRFVYNESDKKSPGTKPRSLR
jgi:hypothetical protein